MEGYAKLYEMLESALRQAGDEAGMLLGQTLSITLKDSLLFSKTAYFADLDDGVFVMAVESREEYQGQFHLVFNLRDAIVMSSTLLGIPAPRIQEKKRLSIIENDDIDAFGEIANMINGALNTTFQDGLPGKAHLKLQGSKKYVPEIDTLSDTDPLPDGEYLMFRSSIEMEGQEMNHLDVMIPVALGNLYDPPPIKAEEPTPAVESAGAESHGAAENEGDDGEAVGEARAAGQPAGASGEDMVAIFEDSIEDRNELQNYLSFTGYKMVTAGLNDDVKEIFAQGNVKLVMIGSQDADDRELAVCIKINALRQDHPVPIIMTAQRWTRTAVLKALKYGARDIIIKPCNLDELANKVKRLCRLS
jgi:CheY-like chemotaxis protein